MSSDVYVCERERVCERESYRLCMVIECLLMCVCVRKRVLCGRERERERERESVCVCV